MTPTYLYRATLNRVIDGDTFVFNVDLGFRVSAAITVRLHGLFAPESSQPGGHEATERAALILATAGQIVLQTYKDQMTFARWVADVWVDGRLLAEILRSEG
jgi:endonuclease YncB( thermonuclease family)